MIDASVVCEYIWEISRGCFRHSVASEPLKMGRMSKATLRGFGFLGLSGSDEFVMRIVIGE